MLKYIFPSLLICSRWKHNPIALLTEAGPMRHAYWFGQMPLVRRFVKFPVIIDRLSQRGFSQTWTLRWFWCDESWIFRVTEVPVSVIPSLCNVDKSFNRYANDPFC